MGEYEKRREHAKIAFMVLSCVVFVISSIYLWWDYRTPFESASFSSHSEINIKPPFDFVEADTIVTNTLAWLEENNLDEGPVLPILNIKGNLEDRFIELQEISMRLSVVAAILPDSASANADTTAEFVSAAQELCKSAARFSTEYLWMHDINHNKPNVIALFFMSLWGVALSVITIAKEA